MQRIYEGGEDSSGFAGCKPKKRYGQEYQQKFEELGIKDDMMDPASAFQSDSTEAAFLDGMGFGMKFFMECMMNA